MVFRLETLHSFIIIKSEPLLNITTNTIESWEQSLFIDTYRI